VIKQTEGRDSVSQLKKFFRSASDKDYIYFVNSEQLIIIIYAFGNKGRKAGHRCRIKDHVEGGSKSVNQDGASALVQTVQGHSQPNLKTSEIT